MVAGSSPVAPTNNRKIDSQIIIPAMMKSKISIVTLGVRDLPRSIAFYKRMGFQLETEENSEHIAFFLANNASLRLALFPRKELAKDIGISDEGNGFSGFTIAHNVKSEAEVDRILQEAENGGAKIVKQGQKVFWGGYSGYFSDDDGFLWEIAHNPFMDLAQ